MLAHLFPEDFFCGFTWSNLFSDFGSPVKNHEGLLSIAVVSLSSQLLFLLDFSFSVFFDRCCL